MIVGLHGAPDVVAAIALEFAHQVGAATADDEQLLGCQALVDGADPVFDVVLGADGGDVRVAQVEDRLLARGVAEEVLRPQGPEADPVEGPPPPRAAMCERIVLLALNRSPMMTSTPLGESAPQTIAVSLEAPKSIPA